MNSEVEFSNKFKPEAKDLINKLLNKDPLKRIGYGQNGYQLLKNHEYFKDLDFKRLKDNKIV